MTVRAWTEEDVKEIARLEAECFSDPWTEGMLADTLRFPIYHTFLAEEGGQVCGYGCIILLFEDAELANIAVAPTHRGQGVGKRILEEMHAYAKARGAERMLLEVRVSNRNAIGLYEKYGYERYGLREHYYADGEDAYLMQKKL
jgi:ribosomal-protein-alanine N-acetyltransferase